MSDLKKYITQRKKRDKRYAERFAEDCEQIKVDVTLRQAVGMTDGPRDT